MDFLFFIGIPLLLIIIAAGLFRRSNDPARQAAKLAALSDQESQKVYQRLLRFSPEMREKMFATYPALRMLYEEMGVRPQQQPGDTKPPPP